MVGKKRPRKIQYPLVNKQLDPENHQFLMETNLPTPMTARVYVNFPEGMYSTNQVNKQTVWKNSLRKPNIAAMAGKSSNLVWWFCLYFDDFASSKTSICRAGDVPYVPTIFPPKKTYFWMLIDLIGGLSIQTSIPDGKLPLKTGDHRFSPRPREGSTPSAVWRTPPRLEHPGTRGFGGAITIHNWGPGDFLKPSTSTKCFIHWIYIYICIFIGSSNSQYPTEWSKISDSLNKKKVKNCSCSASFFGMVYESSDISSSCCSYSNARHPKRDVPIKLCLQLHFQFPSAAPAIKTGGSPERVWFNSWETAATEPTWTYQTWGYTQPSSDISQDGWCLWLVISVNPGLLFIPGLLIMGGLSLNQGWFIWGWRFTGIDVDLINSL